MFHLFNPIDKPLTGLKLLTVGKLSKNKDDLKTAVEEMGGKISTTANKASLCLSTKSELLVNRCKITNTWASERRLRNMSTVSNSLSASHLFPL